MPRGRAWRPGCVGGGWRAAEKPPGQRRQAPRCCGRVLEKALAASPSPLPLLALIPGALVIIQGPGHWQGGGSGSLVSGRKPSENSPVPKPTG